MKLNNRSTSGSMMSAFPRFKCSFPNCSFSAKRMALLKNHIRNHSEEKAFKCRYCSYSTQSRSNCKVHEQRMHTFQRPHKCQYCTYCCVQSSTLRQHVQIKHKDRCQYRCFQCRNFHCQRECQLMFHLLKVHQTSRVSNISPYLNPNYMPDGMFAVAPTTSEYHPVQVESGPFAISTSSTLQQQPQPVQTHSHQNRAAAPQVQQATQYKLIKPKHNGFSPNNNLTMSLVMPRSSQSPGTANSAASTASMWTTNVNAGRTQFRQEKKAIRQASLNDLSEHSLLASSSLIAPLDDPPEVIEIIENDDDEGVSMTAEGKQDGQQLQQSDSHIFVCNHCLSTFASEDSFMNHMMTDHPDGTILDQSENCEESVEQQEGTRQENITSSSSVAYTFSTNQSSMMDTSPVPVAISQNDFAAPVPVKQEQGLLTSQCQQESWLPVSGRDHRVVNDGVSQRDRLGSDSTSENMFPNLQNQGHDSARPASHDGSIGQSVSARENTSPFDMPSPTTTHSNIASASTQTIPLSTNRGGGTTPNQSKYCCVHCKITFPDNVLFTIHRGAHGFHSPFECNFCGKDCGNKYEFASHLHNCS